MSAQKTVAQLTLEEVRAERLRATREYLDLLEERERELTGASSPQPVSKAEPAADLRYTKWPLVDAVVAFLAASDEPQAVKTIAAGLKRAGREFPVENPLLSVKTALREAMAKNDDVIHIGSAKYHLRSKYRGKARLERLMAKANGRGGKTKREHARLTSDGIARRRKDRAHWGPPIKLTPELLERAREMLRNGASLGEVCEALDVSVGSLYAYGVKQRELKKEGQKLKEAAADTADNNVVQFGKAQNE